MASMSNARIVLKDVMLDHFPTFGVDCIGCDCGAVVDDYDQYIGHMARYLSDAVSMGQNPNAPTGRSTVRDAALL